MALLIDHFIRFSAFGVLVLAAFVIFRRGGGALQSRLIAVASLCGAAYLICSSATMRDAFGRSIIILQGICLAGPWAFWAASNSLFKDGFRLRASHAAVLLGFELTGLLAIYGMTVGGLALGLHNLLAFSLFVHAAFVAWRGRGADLVAARRRFRLFYVAGVALLGVTISAVELIVGQTPAPAALETLAAAGVLAVSLLLAVHVLDVDPDKLFLPVAQRRDDRERQSSQTPAAGNFLQKLEMAMVDKRFYCKAGLTIGGLAAELKIPEHRLRAAINEGLGYRNFNAFVNTYRIEAVKKALGDPEQARTPVLTLALESGFNSIAPFNRAFREATGMTPTAFREGAARASVG